jgi:hypothetical protein
MADDDTTDRLFPPPESGIAARPLPLAPSIREEFLAHRLHVDGELKAWRHELGEALSRLSPAPTPGSAMAKAKAGALASLRYGGVALALGEAAAQIAAVSGHAEIAGPIQTLLNLLRGS